MTTTGPFFFFELLPPPRPNALAFVDDDDADRCGRRRSATRPANRATPSVSRSHTVTDVPIGKARQSEDERALESRLDDRRRREAVVGNVVLSAARAAAAVDPHAGAEVDAQRPPARLEAIADADMEAASIEREKKRKRARGETEAS